MSSVAPLLCIITGADASCQDKFGDDPGDTFCTGNVCFWDTTINRFSCNPFDPTEESRSLPNWSHPFKTAEAADAEDLIGTWGRLGIVQCVATRTCKCQYDEDTDEMLCLVTGSETQKAVKYFNYATYVSTDTCWVFE
jgi:hypothetical protein